MLSIVLSAALAADPAGQAAALVAQMTPEERLDMVLGAGRDNRTTGYIRGVPRLHIPALRCSDAVIGLRHAKDATCFPSSLAMSSSFDRGLAADWGRILGREARAEGINILLAPGVNIIRIPGKGRGFEYQSEDPCLTAGQAAAFVAGLKELGVAACPKHFAANFAEQSRKQAPVVVDERALFEIELPGFEACLRAGAPVVMSAYNKLNGTHCGSNPWLLTEVLKGRLGFTGFIVSDWNAEGNGPEAGLDHIMPGRKEPGFAADPAAARVPAERAADAARRILEVGLAWGMHDRTQPDPAFACGSDEHLAVAARAAERGIVLLKNDGGLLPIDRSQVRTICLVGAAAVKTPFAGGGSSFPTQARAPISYAPAFAEAAPQAKVLTGTEAEQGLPEADLAIVFVYKKAGEGADAGWNLAQEDHDLVARCLTANERTIVVVLSGGAVDIAPWSDEAKAILMAWYPGVRGSTALARIIFGDTSPDGHLPVTIPRRFEDHPGAKDAQKLIWSEGVLTGYRGYDAAGIEPLFCFGHGLTYTTFAYEDLRVEPASGDAAQPITVSCTIRNTGSRAAAAAPQLYVEDPQASVPRPPRELKAYDRVTLAPGESRRVELRLTRRDLSFYQVAIQSWVAEPGAFGIRIGESSRDLRLAGSFQLER